MIMIRCCVRQQHNDNVDDEDSTRCRSSLNVMRFSASYRKFPSVDWISSECASCVTRFRKKTPQNAVKIQMENQRCFALCKEMEKNIRFRFHVCYRLMRSERRLCNAVFLSQACCWAYIAQNWNNMFPEIKKTKTDEKSVTVFISFHFTRTHRSRSCLQISAIFAITVFPAK